MIIIIIIIIIIIVIVGIKVYKSSKGIKRKERVYIQKVKIGKEVCFDQSSFYTTTF